jgi:hypothetical protein
MNGEGKHEVLGVMGVRAAVAGFVLPILASLAVLIWQPDLDAGERYRFIAYLIILFVGLETIALIAGLTALDSRAGKLALVLSLLLLLAAGGWYAWKKVGSLAGDTPPAEPEAVPESPGAPGATPPPSSLPPPPPEPRTPPPPMPEPDEDREPGELFPDVPAEG